MDVQNSHAEVSLNEAPYKGYLNNNPLSPKNFPALIFDYKTHVCPCCKAIPDRPALDIDASIMRVGPTFLIAMGHVCQCRFYIPFIAIVNDALIKDQDTQTEIIASKDAYIHDTAAIAVENHLFRYSILLHQQQFKKALNILPMHSPKLFHIALAHFYHGYCLEQMDANDAALDAYDQCLDRDPLCQAAWHNRARLLKQLDRLDEAQFCLTKLQHLKLEHNIHDLPEASSEQVLHTRVLARSQGLFGNVSIVQGVSTRRLMIGDQVQGSFWLKNNTPSNIPSSPYISRLICAASDDSNGHFLVLGLGAGAGVIALLENFKKIHVSVVELDPTLIELAREFFPLITYYERTGRLNIIVGDAFRYVETTQYRYDTVVVDVYRGYSSLNTESFSMPFALALTTKCKNIIINLICKNDRSSLAYFHKIFRDLGILCTRSIQVYEEDFGEDIESNFILQTHSEQPNLNFLPYEEDSTYLAKDFRRDVELARSRTQHFNEIEEYPIQKPNATLNNIEGRS